MTLNERDRVRRFRAGDPELFGELFAEHGEPLFRTCFRLCGNRADAEDLVAETFLAAFEGRERFKGHSSLKTWLFRTAFNRWRDWRKRAHRGDQCLHEDMHSGMPGVEDIALEQALQTLSSDQKEAFLLVKAEGFKYREVAEILGVPQGTIQARVHEAAKKLSEALEYEPLPKPCEMRG